MVAAVVERMLDLHEAQEVDVGRWHQVAGRRDGREGVRWDDLGVGRLKDNNNQCLISGKQYNLNKITVPHLI